MASTAPITQAEMIELFGEEMPIEAVNLIWQAPDDMTLAEIRGRLRELAASRPAKENPAVVEAMARALCLADGRNPDADWRYTGQAMLTVMVKHPEWWRRYEHAARQVLATVSWERP